MSTKRKREKSINPKTIYGRQFKIPTIPTSIAAEGGCAILSINTMMETMKQPTLDITVLQREIVRLNQTLTVPRHNLKDSSGECRCIESDYCRHSVLVKQTWVPTEKRDARW
jgi:hypothetical protein